MIVKLTDSTYRNFFYKKNLYLTGSASTALYIFLTTKKITGKKILIPSNICYSIPFTILYSNNTPLFYDIDQNSGNPSVISIIKLVSTINDIAVILLPNMFGNIFFKRNELLEFLQSNNIAIIDDCAASLGADMGYLSNSGDAAIFSFGKNKHVDLNFGGLLAIDCSIDINQCSESILNSVEKFNAKTKIFDGIYKSILYSDYYYELLPQLKNMTAFFQDSFTYHIDWSNSLIKDLNQKLKSLIKKKKQSISNIRYLNKNINFNSKLYTQYHYSSGSNPWRYNIFINDINLKQEIISQLINNNILVSTWYPPIDTLFEQSYKKGAINFHQRILNIDHMQNTKDQLATVIETINHIGQNYG